MNIVHPEEDINRELRIERHALYSEHAWHFLSLSDPFPNFFCHVTITDVHETVFCVCVRVRVCDDKMSF